MSQVLLLVITTAFIHLCGMIQIMSASLLVKNKILNFLIAHRKRCGIVFSVEEWLLKLFVWINRFSPTSP
jgi:hypothetical protein